MDLTGQVVTEWELTHRVRDPASVIQMLITGMHDLIVPITDFVIGIGVSLGGSIDPDTFFGGRAPMFASAVLILDLFYRRPSGG